MKTSNSFKQIGGAMKVLNLILVLAGHEFTGIRKGELAKATRSSPTQIGHQLKTLFDAGYAEPIPEREEYWRLSPKIVQIAREFEIAMGRAAQNHDQIVQRYTRKPK